MDGDVFAQRKQTHPMPCRDGEGLVVTFDALELATLLDCLLRGGIDATGGLGEIESGSTHNRIYSKAKTLYSVSALSTNPISLKEILSNSSNSSVDVSAFILSK